jgi:hypothetical protein
MSKRPPRHSPTSAGGRRQPAVPRYRSGWSPPPPKPKPAHLSQPRAQSPPNVPPEHAPSSPAVSYSRTSRVGTFRDNAVAKGVVFIAVVAGLLGFVLYAWEESRSPSEDWSPGSSLLRPPAQLPRAGSYVDSRILANGEIRIEHWVRSRTPIREIELVVPHGDGPGGAPRATDVNVAGEVFEASDRTAVGSSAAFKLNYPSRIVRLRYTLVGAVVRSPSAPGRALARFTSADLVYAAEDGGPRMVLIQAPEVLNVACRAPSQGAAPKPCGSQVGTSWQVELSGADRYDEVSAQVNLG